MLNKDLLKFIKEARVRGFEDYQIKEILLKHSWPPKELEEAFAILNPHKALKYKDRVTIYLDSEVLKAVEKRAKKNIFTIPEQIEDILRRSCIRMKSTKKQQEKLDDMLISLFSRKKKR